MNDVPTCKRCGRKLKNPKCIKTGYGKVCRIKHLTEQAKAAYEKKQMILDFGEGS